MPSRSLGEAGGRSRTRIRVYSNQFHLHAKHVKRGDGECLADKLAYNLRMKVYDPRTGTTYDESADAADIEGTFCVGMQGTPEEIAARWEACERHPKAVVAINLEGAIPWQLRGRLAVKLAKAFATDYEAHFHCPLIGGVHKPPKKKKNGKPVPGDARNWHFHALGGLRQIDANGNFSKHKFTGWDAAHFQKEGEENALAWCRQHFCELINEHLENAG